MSAANLRRFVVKAFDYEEWAVVVEALNHGDAIRKAKAIYNADSFGIVNGLDLCWQTQPLVQEVQS